MGPTCASHSVLLARRLDSTICALRPPPDNHEPARANAAPPSHRNKYCQALLAPADGRAPQPLANSPLRPSRPLKERHRRHHESMPCQRGTWSPDNRASAPLRAGSARRQSGRSVGELASRCAGAVSSASAAVSQAPKHQHTRPAGLPLSRHRTRRPLIAHRTYKQSSTSHLSLLVVGCTIKGPACTRRLSLPLA